jgi:hypothetical protein
VTPCFFLSLVSLFSYKTMHASQDHSGCDDFRKGQTDRRTEARGVIIASHSHPHPHLHPHPHPHLHFSNPTTTPCCLPLTIPFILILHITHNTFLGKIKHHTRSYPRNKTVACVVVVPAAAVAVAVITTVAVAAASVKTVTRNEQS